MLKRFLAAAVLVAAAGVGVAADPPKVRVVTWATASTAIGDPRVTDLSGPRLLLYEAGKSDAAISVPADAPVYLDGKPKGDRPLWHWWVRNWPVDARTEGGAVYLTGNPHLQAAAVPTASWSNSAGSGRLTLTRHAEGFYYYERADSAAPCPRR